MAKIFQILILFISLISVVNAVDITVSSSSNESTWYGTNISGNININNVTTFSWETGIWSGCNASCGGGVKTRTVVCRGSDGGVYSDSLCSGTKPSTIETCNNFPCYTYSWSAGSWGSCSANPTRSAGSWGSCSANPTRSAGSWGSCSANPTRSAGSWGSCSATCGGGTQNRSTSCSGTSGTQSRSTSCSGTSGTQSRSTSCSGTSGTQNRSTSCSGTSGTQNRSTSCSGTSGSENRSVVCKRNDGQTVVDGFCGGGKPSTSQSCSESCSIGSRPSTSQSCSESCSSGSQPSTSQSCSESCSIGSRPSTSQSCNESCSSGSQPSTSQSCSESCSIGSRPSTSQSCNTQACFDCTSPNGMNGDTYTATKTCCTIERAGLGCDGWRDYNYTKTCSAGSWNGSYTCPSPAQGCFISGTMITLSNGTQINIEDVVVGDKLKGSQGVNTVKELKRYTNTYKVYSINDDTNFVTSSHPFMTKDGWKAFDPEKAKVLNPDLSIKKLTQGDTLIRIDGEIVLEKFNYVEKYINVYNFEVSGTRDYYANGYLVHNK